MQYNKIRWTDKRWTDKRRTDKRWTDKRVLFYEIEMSLTFLIIEENSLS